LIDTYRLLVRGFKGEPSAFDSERAAATARSITVPARVRQAMVASLRTAPPEVAVAGLSTASLRVRENLILVSDGISPLSQLTESDILPLSVSEAPAQDDPPNAGWHRWLYANSDARAVLVVHPTCAVTFAVHGMAPDPSCFPVGAREVGNVSVVSADPASWPDLTTLGSVLLVAEGALIAWDKTLAAAIAKVHIVARWCEIQTAILDRQRYA
jgi:ribulose-5-phosphate 4-epimerase/fuculose-1-phosphate aldolase